MSNRPTGQRSQLTEHNFCALAVWYNPTQDYVQNALSYASHFPQIFIVDNSEGDNSSLASQIPNAVYISNGKNLGIARALNQGIEAALSENSKGRDYRWVMTMDQDSAWDKEQLEKYIALCIQQSGQDEAIKSFSPIGRNVSSVNHSTLGLWKRKLYKLITRKEYKEKMQLGSVDRTLTSGNVIEIEAWQKVGRFDEVLFIDEVDHDFCYRLREAGFKILKSEIVMQHQIQDGGKRTFLPYDFSKGSPMRLFYIFRNMFFVIKKYPWAAKQFHYKANVLKLAIRNCIFDKKAFSNIKILIRAYKDYKQTLLPLIKTSCQKG